MIRTCQACGKDNRIPAPRLGDAARCGACKTAIPPLDHPIDIGRDDFNAVVQAAKVPVLVDFWADWCGPCRMAAPEVARVAKNLAGRALVLKVNTEQQPELAHRFGVQGIPNFVVLKDGDVVLQQPGLVDHRRMEQWLRQAGA